MTKPTFVLCPPDYFEVSYVINPWMQPEDWRLHKDDYLKQARLGWEELVATLSNAGAAIHVMPAAPGVPDLVFTANIASVLDRKVMLARFRHPERRPEEPHVARFFAGLHDQGVVGEIRPCPPGLTFEGAGDAVWDEARDRLWFGHGPRSSPEMAEVLRQFYHVPVTPLKLVDPRFYHLDTAFCPLPGGDAIYYPAAFDAESRDMIGRGIEPEKLVAIGEDDACLLAANGVAIGRTLIAGAMTDRLKTELERRGYKVILTNIGSFAKSGGAAYCLTLRLDRRTGRASGGADVA